MKLFEFLRGLIRPRASPRRLLQEIERYDRIFRGSRGYGFVDWDLDANYMHWNGGFWSYLGYSNRDMKSISNPDSFTELIHPDDKDVLQNAVSRHIKLFGPGEAMVRIRKRHGGFVWTEIRVESIRKENGHVRYVSGLIFDISKLKQIEEALLASEARHSRILKASNDGVWEWTAEYGGFHFSSRCWEQLGYQEGDEPLNSGVDRLGVWRSRIHIDDLVLFDKTLSDHFMKKASFDVEYRILGKDDDWRWIRARGQMHYSSDGRPWRMSGTNMDITELKRAEERVLKAKELAEQANKAKSEFLSSMSHELRTPLNAILGFAQIFELDTNLTSDQRDNINEIIKGGQHLLGLVNEVLDLAKIESGRVFIKSEAVDPIRVINDCVSLVQTQADAMGISIQVNNSENEIETVYADRRRLRQVLLNLLSNAIKYNSENGSIRINCREIDGRFCQISVTDTGRGISTEQQESVFLPFNRLGAEHSQIEGTGVGLVICKRLVEQMGGDMGFRSVVREGSTFWFQLPLEPENADSADTLSNDVAKFDLTQEAQDVNEVLLTVSGERHILYVEDSLPNQRLMQQIFSRYPELSLTVAGEGFSGLFEARTTLPDLIIMDINLPGMSGYETLNILKRDSMTENIPVIALSANAMEHDIQSGLDAGFEHYLTKPLQLSELIQILNEHFGASQAH